MPVPPTINVTVKIAKMKRFFFLAFLSFLLISGVARAQQYLTRTGQVTFRSEAPEELIEAQNNDVAAQLIVGEAKGQFIIPIKSFKFKKALLQEHFNENYMESDTYPKATYRFTIEDIQNVDFRKPGRYPVRTNGVLTLKKTPKTISVPGYIVVSNGDSIKVEASFSLSPADYDIQIPKLVESKIAKNIEINVQSTLSKP